MARAATEIEVYLAARFYQKAEAAKLAEALTREGGVIRFPWFFAKESSDGGLSFAQRGERARDALRGVASCDALILLNPLEDAASGTGGCHVELGYALALWKPVVVVGVYSNVFHHLDQVQVASGPRTAMAAVRVLLELQQRRLMERAARHNTRGSGRWIPS